MKYIVIVPDGMWDTPIEELGDKTPLEVARRTNMDYLATHGRTGLIKTIPDKMPPGSDVGNLSLMGYDPTKHALGRAPLEAANMGIDLAPDEVVFRCNLVTVRDNTMVDYSAGHIKSEEAAILIEALNKELQDEKIRFIAGKSYRHLLIIKVRDVHDFLKISCTPPHDIMDQNIKKYLPQGNYSPAVTRLIEKSREILGKHQINTVRIDLKENPANMIWLWGQGTKPQLPTFKSRYGVDGSVISAVDLVNGIGRLAGLDVIRVPGITGYYDTNYRGKAEYALASLKNKDFVFVHIEGPDEAGHNGDYKAKISCIENIDREIIGAAINHFDKNDDFRILVLPDHPTPVKLRTHTREPVGYVMFGKGVPANGSTEYTETAVRAKGLEFQNGEALMEYFIRKYL